MSRILLVDDSPHAQRIGERILTGEGFEVVTVSNADTALVRIEDVDPDIVIADTVMPGRTGYEICQYLKMSPRHRHVRVILTAGVLEPIDEAQALYVRADGSLKKPFEATALVAAVRQLAEAAAHERRKESAGGGAVEEAAPVTPSTPFVAVVDAEQVRAAVMVALDASMDAMAEEISRRVVVALQNRKSDPKLLEGAHAPASNKAAPSPLADRIEAVRRVHPLRVRGSMLGIEAGRPESE
jgi:CheY-like chemotaxis protein